MKVQDKLPENSVLLEENSLSLAGKRIDMDNKRKYSALFTNSNYPNTYTELNNYDGSNRNQLFRDLIDDYNTKGAKKQIERLNKKLQSMGENMPAIEYITNRGDSYIKIPQNISFVNQSEPSYLNMRDYYTGVPIRNTGFSGNDYSRFGLFPQLIHKYNANNYEKKAKDFIQ